MQEHVNSYNVSGPHGICTPVWHGKDQCMYIYYVYAKLVTSSYIIQCRVCRKTCAIITTSYTCSTVMSSMLTTDVAEALSVTYILIKKRDTHCYMYSSCSQPNLFPQWFSPTVKLPHNFMVGKNCWGDKCDWEQDYNEGTISYILLSLCSRIWGRLGF